MPAGPVEHEDHALVRTGPDLVREGGRDLAEQGRVHAVGHDPGNLAGRGPDEAEQIQPLEAMMADRVRPAAAGRPDATDHRLQPDPVLVERPDLERSVRIRVLTVLDLLPEAGFEGDLGIEVARGMAWPGHLSGEVEPVQIVQPTARRHQAPDRAGDPLGNLAPGPQAVARRL